MPGTGHSARYKGSISNRSKVSPFEQLAKWNQDLFGADGMVPSITGGGGSLEFKKLNASDISGVMSNPATADLNMNNFKIFNATNITLSGTLTIDATTSDMVITNTTTVGKISKFGGQIRITSNDVVGLSTSADLVIHAAAATPNATISLTDTRIDSKIEIGHQSIGGAAITNLRQIKIGVTASGYNGGEQIDIGSTSIGGITNRINIGNTGQNCKVNLTATGLNGAISLLGKTLTLGNSSTSQAGLTSETTTVTGNDRLNLVSDAGGQIRMYANGVADIYIGSQAGDKIGFRGATPIPQNQMVIGTNLPNANVAYQQSQMQDVIDKVNAIRESLVRVGLCQQ